MTTLLRTGAFLLFAVANSIIVRADDEVCMPSAGNVFHVQVDLFASDLGHYTFAECGDIINPTLGLRRHETYTFVQSDRTNYYHPIGFKSASRFFSGSSELSREFYQRRFVESTHIWAGYDEFSVKVTIGDEAESSSLAYFCLVHNGMDGPIRILEDTAADTASNQVGGPSGSLSRNSPFVDNRSEFDRQCGTYGLDAFQLPNGLCPDRFVCGTDAVTDELQSFAQCLEAANCAMLSGMTTAVQATDDSALFIHQMIPHHENAVNTAKTLLKTGNLLCPNLTDQSNPDCVLESMLLTIISGQNSQIQLMRKFLSDRNYPQEDNCDVYVRTVDDEPLLPGGSGANTQVLEPSSSESNSAAATSWTVVMGTVWVVNLLALFS